MLWPLLMNFRYTALNMVVFFLLSCLLYISGWLPFQNEIEYNLRLLFFGSDRTTAIIIGESTHGHGAVAYEYSINGKIYNGDSIIPHNSGESLESYRSRKKAGNEVTVYYSTSKPELSALGEPELPLVALGMLSLFAIVLYGYLAIEVIPKMSKILKKCFTSG